MSEEAYEKCEFEVFRPKKDICDEALEEQKPYRVRYASVNEQRMLW